MSEAVREIADKADMIVDGYAFTNSEAGCRIIDLNNTHSAMVVDARDRVLETTMDDIEIGIVMDLYKRNKKFMGVTG